MMAMAPRYFHDAAKRFFVVRAVRCVNQSESARNTMPIMIDRTAVKTAGSIAMIKVLFAGIAMPLTIAVMTASTVPSVSLFMVMYRPFPNKDAPVAKPCCKLIHGLLLACFQLLGDCAVDGFDNKIPVRDDTVVYLHVGHKVRSIRFCPARHFHERTTAIYRYDAADARPAGIGVKITHFFIPLVDHVIMPEKEILANDVVINGSFSVLQRDQRTHSKGDRRYFLGACRGLTTVLDGFDERFEMFLRHRAALDQHAHARQRLFHKQRSALFLHFHIFPPARRFRVRALYCQA